MAKHILQFDELHNECGWTCISIKDVGKIGNQWYTPARALNMEPVEYIQWLINEFHPDYIKFSSVPQNGLLIFYWNKQDDMRVFKNTLNKRLRQVKFYVD